MQLLSYLQLSPPSRHNSFLSLMAPPHRDSKWGCLPKDISYRQQAFAPNKSHIAGETMLQAAFTGCAKARAEARRGVGLKATGHETAPCQSAWEHGGVLWRLDVRCVRGVRGCKGIIEGCHAHECAQRRMWPQSHHRGVMHMSVLSGGCGHGGIIEVSCT